MNSTVNNEHVRAIGLEIKLDVNSCSLRKLKLEISSPKDDSGMSTSYPAGSELFRVVSARLKAVETGICAHRFRTTTTKVTLRHTYSLESLPGVTYFPTDYVM